MSGSSLGRLFVVTNFGESHGPAIGCVVDGCPPGLPLSESDLQYDLDRRKPGTSRHVTQRQEQDKVEILSGVFEGKTTGAPIGLLIRNQDQRSKDYDNISPWACRLYLLAQIRYSGLSRRRKIFCPNDGPNGCGRCHCQKMAQFTIRYFDSGLHDANWRC